MKIQGEVPLHHLKAFLKKDLLDGSTLFWRYNNLFAGIPYMILLEESGGNEFISYFYAHATRKTQKNAVDGPDFCIGADHHNDLLFLSGLFQS